MVKISILDLEQRTNPINELNKLRELLEKEKFLIHSAKELNFLELIDFTIESNPISGTANSCNDYFKERGISLDNTSDDEATNTLLYFSNFILNTINWFLSDKNFLQPLFFTNEITNRFKQHIKSIKLRIERILELLNYKEFFPENDLNSEFYVTKFIKRNFDVDSVLPLVKPDTRTDLLTYLDFVIEDNLIEKQAILKRLADYLEPDRKEYEEVNKELTSKIFHLFNNFRIRHNNNQALFENEAEQIEYYDICFKMVLHLIREKEIQEYLNKINQKFNRE